MLEVGRIARPHGVRGDVNVVLTTNRSERVSPGAVLHAPGRVLTVQASRPHKRGWIVTFSGVNDRDQAEALGGAVLSAEPISDPEEMWVHELIGAAVFDQNGDEQGSVVGVVDNPASDLLELDSGALVPLQFITTFEPSVRVVVDAPEGLFDLGES